MVTESVSQAAIRATAAIGWRDAYTRNLWISDTLIITFVVFLSQFAWFTFTGVPVGRYVDSVEPLSYTWLSIALIVAWLIALSVSGSRGQRVVGLGTAEYRLVINSALYLFAVLAIVSYLLSAQVSRGYLLLGFPLGMAALVASRALWRRQLWAARRRGEAMSRVLVLGDENESARIIMELEGIPEAGYQVVGVSGPGKPRELTYAGNPVPFLGAVDDVPGMLAMTGADTVIVASDSALPVSRVREISWQLEEGLQHLIMVPNLTDIGGPRIHTRPVAGLPLMHVETPRYTGRQRFLKRGFDLLVSGALLLLLAPLFILLAVLVKASGPGPVFYRQERVGHQGEPFRMIKFRTMVPDADRHLKHLLEEQGTADKPLFKVENDPRVTPIGRTLRKYSLDEFPQLLNVLFGDMSLVGPRPQREGEVAFYDSAAERRLIVKPGMSGLWQVSGRSALSWDEAIRLDLYYVENWTLLGDISILIRTFKAVIAPGKTAH